MASFLQFLPTILSLHWLIIINIGFISSNQIPPNKVQPYVVYMGSSSSNDVEVAKLAHLQLLSSIIPSEESERINLIHHYSHAFKGFSAMLTEKEASALSEDGEVVSVFPDPILKLHTTRSWDFLEPPPTTTSSSTTHHNHHLSTEDVIIGIIDTEASSTCGSSGASGRSE
ncbi:hypothetical protein Q3G72_016016 [Acer saccharum]|nr:hypothetical protein Q3G72_016016 [Acer saccharum]